MAFIKGDNMKNVFFALFAVVLTACGGEQRTGGGDFRSAPFSDESVAGVISGEPWVFKSGVAQRSFSNDGTYTLKLWDKKVANPCAEFWGSEKSVMGTIPRGVGSFEVGMLGDKLSYTLVDGTNGMSMNYIVEGGQLEITKRTASKITGKLKAYFDEENEVNGSFTVEICD